MRPEIKINLIPEVQNLGIASNFKGPFRRIPLDAVWGKNRCLHTNEICGQNRFLSVKKGSAYIYQKWCKRFSKIEGYLKILGARRVTEGKFCTDDKKY